MEIVSLSKAYIVHLVEESKTVTCENALSLYLHHFASSKNEQAAMKTTVEDLSGIFNTQGKTLHAGHIKRRLGTIIKWHKNVKKSLKAIHAEISWNNFKQKLEAHFHQHRPSELPEQMEVSNEQVVDVLDVERNEEVEAMEEDENENEDNEDDANDPDYVPQEESVDTSEVSQFVNNAIRSPLVTAACMRARVSPGNLMMLTTAMNFANGIQPDAGGNAKQTIYQTQVIHRQQIGAKIREHIKEKLSSGNVVLGWDGKRMANWTKVLGEPKIVDRVAIVATNSTGSEILSIEKMISGKGDAVGSKLMDVVSQYGLQSSVKALLFDTTQANTGIRKGAAVVFENLMGRYLLYLGCRHHIFEVFLATAFLGIFRIPTSKWVFIHSLKKYHTRKVPHFDT